MRLVTTLAAVAVGTTALAVPATAAKLPPKVCNLVVDDKGDWNTESGDASVDIVGGDFASNAKQLTAIIRLDKLANPNPFSPLGQAYYAAFTVKGSSDTLTLSAGLYPQGNEFKFGYEAVDPNTGVNTSYALGDATGVVDMAKSEIHITVDVAKYPQAKLLKAGNKVTTLAMDARRVYGQRIVPSQNTPVGVRVPLGGATLTFDDATGKTYTLGAPSCVAIGK